MNVGDYTLEDTVTIPFTTRAFDTGIPTALVSGEVQIYEDDGVTQITAAETTTVSLDSVAGFNMTSIAATAANGFEAGKSYTAILSAGTVGGVSVIGEVVGHFTIARSAAAADLATITGSDGVTLATTQANYAPLKPTTAGRTLDVTATGAAGIDWGNVENPTTAVDLSGTDIQLCDTTTVITTLPTGFAAATFPSVVASTTNIAGGTITTVSGNVDGNVGGNVNGAVAGAVGSCDGLAASVYTTIAQNVWNRLLAQITTSGSVGELVKNILNDWADGGRLDALLDAIPTTPMRGTDSANTVVPDAAGTAATLHSTTDGLITTVDTVVDAIKAITDALGATAAARLALSAGQIIPFTVDTVTNTHTPTTTEFQADDITEATADHYNGRIVIFTSGALAGQATDITDYEAVGGIGQFTLTALTEAPGNDDTGIIV